MLPSTAASRWPSALIAIDTQFLAPAVASSVHEAPESADV